MEDTNHQDSVIDIDNQGNSNDDESIIVEDGIGIKYEKLDEKTLQRLEQNLPSVVKLDIDSSIFCADDSVFKITNWKENGYCISDNTYLKELRINNSCPKHFGFAVDVDKELPTKEQLQYFFSSIHENRSIKVFEIISVSIDDEFGGWVIEGLSGHHSLKKLEIGSYIETAKLGSRVCSALGQVLKHPKSKLKILHLRSCDLDDGGCKVLSDGLLGNSTMKRLYLSGNRLITSTGWRALSTVFQSPNCNLIELELFNTGINDEGAELLGSALCGSSLKTLNLSLNKSISSRGWQTLFNQISQTSIESLNISNNRIDDAGLAALAATGTLKSLDLIDNRSITSSGWWAFFNLLQRIGTQLVNLHVSYNHIGDVGVAALGRLMGSMSTLKKLVMNNMMHLDNNITSQGWLSFFSMLQESDDDLDLVHLYLGDNNIDDEGMQLLVRLLSNMISLKYVNLSWNQSVTPVGWRAFTGFLLNPNFALEYLGLYANRINDDIVVAFASALAHNKTLESMSLEEFVDEDGNELIIEGGWDAISTLVCNESSIMGTYNSNHILHNLGDEESELLGDLISLLELNENKDKSEVARQKILQTHFPDDDTSKLQELLDMELEMMPSVMSWIGRPAHDDWKGKNVSGLSTMFNLMRRLPDLFDSSPQTQTKQSTGKRKRGIL